MVISSRTDDKQRKQAMYMVYMEEIWTVVKVWNRRQVKKVQREEDFCCIIGIVLLNDVQVWND